MGTLLSFSGGVTTVPFLPVMPFLPVIERESSEDQLPHLALELLDGNGEHISDTPFGLDEARRAWVAFELASQA
jgi:hypothetical protein